MTQPNTIYLTPQSHPDWDSPSILSLTASSTLKDDDQLINPSVNIILGRGKNTSVMDTRVSRRLCSIEFHDPDNNEIPSKKRKAVNNNDDERLSPLPILRMLQEPDVHKFEINYEKVSINVGDFIYLNDGDILSLHASTPFRYKVSYKPRSQKQYTTPKNISTIHSMDISGTPPSASVRDDIISKASMNLLEDMKCPICMEIFVDSHASSCGHIFCGPCVKNCLDLKSSRIDCPTCRKKIQSFTLVRQYDSMIWNMLLCMPFPPQEHSNLRDDVLVFLQRSGKDVSSLSSEETKCLFGSNSI